MTQFTELQEIWEGSPTAAWNQSGPLSALLGSQEYGDLHDLTLYTSLAQEAGPLPGNGLAVIPTMLYE